MKTNSNLKDCCIVDLFMEGDSIYFIIYYTWDETFSICPVSNQKAMPEELIAYLEEFFHERKNPQYLICDNSPIYRSKKLTQWLRENKVEKKEVLELTPTAKGIIELSVHLIHANSQELKSIYENPRCDKNGFSLKAQPLAAGVKCLTGRGRRPPRRNTNDSPCKSVAKNKEIQ